MNDTAPLLNRIPENWGKFVSCDKGWLPLLLELDKKTAQVDPLYTILQIKEKFGGLRFYYELSSTATSEVREQVKEWVSRAEQLAEVTCEQCGEKGQYFKLNFTGKILCPRHGEEASSRVSQR